MKKLLLICAIAFSSCTPDEPTDCDCTGVFRLNNQTGTNVFYMKVKVDCNTEQIISEIPANYQFWGCK